MTADEYKEEVKCIRPDLVATALRYMGDADEAEDVVQDVLLKMWQLVDTLHLPLGSFGGILVRNHCIDLLRQKRRITMVTVVNENIVRPHDEDDERMDRVMNAIQQLPPIQQTIMQLRHMDGMKMSEIAQLMGTTEVAVRKTLSRSRQAILKSFKNHEYE